MFPYFELFGRVVGSYAVCSVMGMMVCAAVGTRLGARYKVSFEELLLYMVAIVLGLLAGGHILFGLTHLEELVKLLGSLGSLSGKEILAGLGTVFGGMVFYGGFLGGAAALWFYVGAHKKHSRWVLFDLYGALIPLFHTFGRVGCFLGGCCYGREGSWGFVVHGNPLVPEINDIRRIPVPLLEAACNLCIFFLLLYLYQRGRQKGRIVFWYMVIYAPVRFVLEFFRGDAVRGIWWGLSTSQWISILLFITGIAFLGRFGRRKQNITGVITNQ